MKKSALLFILSLTVAIIFLHCAPYKMKAIRAQRDRRYDLSIKFALRQLRAHPNDLATKRLLNEAAREYYHQLRQQIEHFERLNNWQQVVRVAGNGYAVLYEVSTVVGTNFPTREQLEYLQAKRQQSKHNQANKLYIRGIKLFDQGNYSEALAQFRQVVSYVPHFKNVDRFIENSKQKLASQQYNRARQLLDQGRLEDALQGFEQAAAQFPNFLDVTAQIARLRQQLAEKYYHEAQGYFNSGNYKNAYQVLKRAQDYQPDYPLARQLLEATKNKLTVRLAVFPFTTSKLDHKFGELVSQKILSNALPQKNELIMFLEREHLQKIFEEQALSQTGAIDEKTAVQVGKLSGVNTIVIGSATLVSHNKTGITRRTLTGHYNRKYRDPRGVVRTKKEPFQYLAYKISRTVQVNLSYRLIDVETGQIIFNDSRTQQASDSAEWITCPRKFVKYLPPLEKKKLKAERQPRSQEALINQAIEGLAKQAAAKIISRVASL